jgi:hypothetical protein
MDMRAQALSWTEANQACLAAEFEWIETLFGANPDPSVNRPARSAARGTENSPAIDRLAELFELSAFERDIVLFCAGVEMESGLASLCAGAQSASPAYGPRACPTFGLALARLPGPHWSALAPSSPLRRFRLVEVDASKGLASAPLRIDERILHYLAGSNELDPKLQPLMKAAPSPGWIAADHQAIAARVERALVSPGLPAIELCGDDAQGQEDVAAASAEAKCLMLFVLSAEDLAAAGDLNRLAALWERESLLLDGALLLQCASSALSPAARQFAERLPPPLFLASREPIRLNRPVLRFDVDKPEPAEQKRLWERALGPRAEESNGAVEALAGHFRLSARTIFAASKLPDSPEQGSGGLWSICRALARPRLEDLAERVVPAAGWDDLVLPESQTRTLRQLADQVRCRMTVYETWGFSGKGRRGLGVSALFAGPSGTGKTLAAEVLAHELALDLYRVDLATVVSKFIGETEKNLKQVFDAAEEGGVLLLFDEADALFGKRSEVRDSHDRYANIEVGYLLQRMETYRGLAVLTTNLKSTIDKAFQRRLRFIVNFPFPDAAQREAIWRRAFPRSTPTRGLEPQRLAQLNMAGGNIANIALNAAFAAAAAGEPVGMTHVLEATRLEAVKIERPLAELEIRGWA